MAEDQVHPHPLLIELVLESMFKNMSKPTLLTCRQVCSEWRHEALKYFKPLKAYARVDTTDSVYQLISTYVNCPETGRPRFRLTVDWAALGECDLELLLEVIGSNTASVAVSPMCSADLVKIFKTLLRHVPHLEELEFQGLMDLIRRPDQQTPRLNRLTSFTRWRRKYLQEFKSLTKFEMDIRIAEEDSSLATDVFYTEILAIMPSLKSFKLIILEPSASLVGIGRALNNKRQVSRGLKSLTISSVDNHLLEDIKDVEMMLEELGLIFLCGCIDAEFIERALRAQAPYLKCLALGGTRRTSHEGRRMKLTSLGPPFEMPNLEEFKLLGELVANDRTIKHLEVVQWQGLNWRLQMPKLRKLELTNLRPACFETIFGSGSEVLSETLTSLIMKVTDEVPCADHLRRLSEAFPSLIELEVVVDSAESLGLVFQSWSKLKKLKLGIAGDIAKIDEVFTGVQFKKCSESELEEDISGYEVFQDAVGFKSEGRGITNLEELEDLTVEFRKAVVFGQRSPVGDGYLLSDVAGALALLMMKKLNAVRINKSKMTRDLINLLRVELHAETCIINDRFGVSTSGGN